MGTIQFLLSSHMICLHNQLVHLNSHSFQIHSFFQRKLASHIKPRSCCVIDATPLQENGFGFDGLAQKSGLQGRE